MAENGQRDGARLSALQTVSAVYAITHTSTASFINVTQAAYLYRKSYMQIRVVILMRNLLRKPGNIHGTF